MRSRFSFIYKQRKHLNTKKTINEYREPPRNRYNRYHEISRIALKTPGNHRFSNFFQGCRKRPVTWNGLMSKQVLKTVFSFRNCELTWHSNEPLQTSNISHNLVKSWTNCNKKTLYVVTIAMVCSTLPSLLKFQYFRRPI